MLNRRDFPIRVASAILSLLTTSASTALAFQYEPAQDSPQNDSSAATGSIISTVAGTGFIGDSGNGDAATKANLISPRGIASDSAGNLYISDSAMSVVRKVTASTGKISIYAGTFGVSGYSGDGEQATVAKLDQPQGLAVDSSDNLYIADMFNQVIRQVNAQTGVITTVAGNGQNAWSGHGNGAVCTPYTAGLPAMETSICYPVWIAVDSAKNLYITTNTYRIVKVGASTHIVTTVAGTGRLGYSGDGGLAVNATMSEAGGLAVDKSGNVYFADGNNCAVRKVTASTGKISSLVGKPVTPYSGQCGLSGDGGPSTQAEVFIPNSVAVDSHGNVFIADSNNFIIRMIAASSGRIYTIAGKYLTTEGHSTGENGYTGDGGPATQALLGYPTGIALDGHENLFIADEGFYVVRKVTNANTIP